MTAFFRQVREKVDEMAIQLQPPGEFFQNKRKWEIKELKKDLNSSSILRQKAALKRIIANMTLGRDVSALFVDVVKVGQTGNLELKKLVHLYILHNAKLRPEESFLVVNSFVMDLNSTSPLVRALVLRTMMSVCDQGVMDHTIGPLRRILSTEEDPYVVKTAVFGAGKLFHYSEKRFWSAFGETPEDNSSPGEPKLLFSRLQPSNAAVVCGNMAALIKEVLDYRKYSISTSFLGCDVFDLHKKLESANDWSKIYILELLSELDLREASSIEKLLRIVLPYLHHGNPAVVLSAIKVLAMFAGRCPTTNFLSAEIISEEVNAALRLLSKREPETQYVVLKNIHSLVVVFPRILHDDLRMFFVSFDDPPYVKIEKVRLLLKLVGPSSGERVFLEFRTYAHDVDHFFVEEVVKAIGSLGVMLEFLATRCVGLLRSVLDWHPVLNSAVLQASYILAQKYPHFLEIILEQTVLPRSGMPIIKLEDLIEKGGKETLLLLLAEYPKSISNETILGILEEVAAQLLEEEPSVQLQFLRTIVTIWTRDPGREQGNASELNAVTPKEGACTPAARVKSILHNGLQLLGTKSEDADVRDRAMSYWRLFSRGPTPQQLETLLAAISPLPSSSFSVNSSFSDEMTLKDLKRSINTTAAILGCPPRSFLPPYGARGKKQNECPDSEEEDEAEQEEEDDDDEGDEENEEGGGGNQNRENTGAREKRKADNGSPTPSPCGLPHDMSARSTVMNEREVLGSSIGIRGKVVSRERSTIPSLPRSEADFLLAWDTISEGNHTTQRELWKDLSAVQANRISSWLTDHGFVVAAVISSLQKTVFMASAPFIDDNALFQWVVSREPLSMRRGVERSGSVVIVKGERCHELVHVLALQLEKVSADVFMETTPTPNEVSLEDLFS